MLKPISLVWWGQKDEPERQELKDIVRKAAGKLLVIPKLKFKRWLSEKPDKYLEGRFVCSGHPCRLSGSDSLFHSFLLSSTSRYALNFKGQNPFGTVRTVHPSVCPQIIAAHGPLPSWASRAPPLDKEEDFDLGAALSIKDKTLSS